MTKALYPCLALGLWLCGSASGAMRPYDRESLDTYKILVEDGEARKFVRAPRSLLVAPLGRAAVIFPPEGAVRDSKLFICDDSGDRSEKKLEDFLKADPLREKGGGKIMEPAEGNPWVLEKAKSTPEALRKFNSRFNAHAYALDALGFTPADWIEGGKNDKTADTYPMDVLLMSYGRFMINRDFAFDPGERPKAVGTENEIAAAERTYRANSLKKALETAKKIEEFGEGEDKLKTGDIVTLTAIPVPKSGFTERLQVYSGRLVRSDGRWLVASKPEGHPVIITSLGLLVRAHAGEFNEFQIYRLKGLRAGTLAKGDLAKWGAKYDWDKVAPSVFPLTFKEGTKKAWSRTAFFISPKGHFVTTYDVLSKCVDGTKDRAEFGKEIACKGEGFSYSAKIGGKTYAVAVVSHLSEKDSMGYIMRTNEVKTIWDLWKDNYSIVGRVQGLPEDLKVLPLSFAAPEKAPDVKTSLIKMDEPLPRAFIPGFNESGDFRTLSFEIPFKESKARGVFTSMDWSFAAVTIPMPANLEQAELQKRAKMRDEEMQKLAKAFPKNGMGDGINLSMSMMGAPFLGADGKVGGYVQTLDQSLPLAFFQTSNVILDNFFVKEKPRGEPLTIDVAGVPYYLKEE